MANAPKATATAAMPPRIAGVKSATNTLSVVGLGVAVGSEVGSCVGCCVGEGEGLVGGRGCWLSVYGEIVGFRFFCVPSCIFSVNL